MAESLLAVAAVAAPETAAAIGASSTFAALPSAGTLLSVGSAASSIMGGSQGAAVSKMQARQAELSARQEELKGREQAAQIRRQLSASLASQNAIFAARGINPTMGTPRVLSQESASQAARDIDITRFGAAQSAGALRSQAKQYQIEGSSKRFEGFAKAGTSLYSLV